MATVGLMGPFHRTDELKPHESRWVDLGEADGFALCALSITATPDMGVGARTHVLTVDNVNITTIDSGHGDIPIKSYFAGCNVTNNGESTVTSWSVLAGVIRP